MKPSEAEALYGPIVDGKWPREHEFCGLYRVPKEIQPYLISVFTGSPTKTFYCNKDFMPYLEAAFTFIISRRLYGELKSFDGCFNVRRVRGSDTVWSAHSYGIAIDINAATNRLGTFGDISDALGRCFTDAGMIWGRGFVRRDPQHFSLGW